MPKGSIYILKNPAFSEANLLKIGQTEQTAEKRAKKLSTTGLPDPFYVVYEQDVPDCVLAEKLVHKELENYRYRKEREFFILPAHEAITTVQRVIQEKFYKIFDIPEEAYLFNKGMTLRRSFQFNGIIFLTRYESIFATELSIVDMWWCKPKDHVLVTNRINDAPEKLVEFASNSCVPGSLSDIINIYPGDRLAIVEASTSKGDINQLSLFENSSSIRIVDFREYARMVGFMENVEIHSSGSLIPFGASEHEDVSMKDSRKAVKKIIDLGMPRTLPDPEYAKSLKSGFDYYYM